MLRMHQREAVSLVFKNLLSVLVGGTILSSLPNFGGADL